MTSLDPHIYNILLQTQYYIIHKSQFNQYNIQYNNIDFILLTPNFLICIYTNHLYNNIEHFITEVNTLSYYIQRQCICFYFNIFKLTSEQEKLFINENNKLINLFISINGSNINKLLNIFLRGLYYFGIYCYDNDSNCIMLEKIY